MAHKIIILLADGFEETEALAPADVLRRGNQDVKLLSVTGNLAVKSSHNVSIIADDTLLGYTEDYDMIMLPGGMPGTTNLNDHALVKEELKRAYAAGKLISAICAAPMVLGGLGFLSGRRATCYPGFEQYLTGATITNEDVVADGNIITGIGAGAALKFGVALLAALEGEELAADVAQKMIMR